jgi:hypothetical protein
VSLDLTTVQRQAVQLASSVGRATMHQLYPNDFEYYMIALELVDGSGNTIDYLAFPILPSSITKSENKRINIKKAFKSTLVLTSSAFTPQDITIRGNFGRGFKILIGTKEILNGLAFINSVKNGVFSLGKLFNKGLSLPTAQFSRFVKTGYGVTKLLQSIIQKSDGSDHNGPYRLYLYNYALGESYLVVAPSKALTLEQNDSNMNMIWNYTLNLTIIAPLESIKNAISLSSVKRLLTASIVQGTVNKVGRDVVNYVSRIKSFRR